MATTQSKLPVYLIHYDRPRWSASAAATIAASIGIEVDLTVVDNGERGDKTLVQRLLPGTRVLPMSANRGYTGAANVALRDWAARFPSGNYCVLGSHDLHVEPDTLARLVQLAEDRPDAGIVAPALVAPEPAAGGTWKRRAPRQRPPRNQVELVEAQWASGTCLLLRRACVDMIGPFDERLGSYLEDVDYGLRASDQGWRVLVLTSAHARGLGSVSNTEMWGLRAANTVLMNAKQRRRTSSDRQLYGVGSGRGSRVIARAYFRGVTNKGVHTAVRRTTSRRRPLAPVRGRQTDHDAPPPRGRQMAARRGRSGARSRNCRD